MKEVSFKLSDEVTIKFAHINLSAIQVYQTADGSYLIEYDASIPEEIIEAIQDQIMDELKPKKIKSPKKNLRGRKILIPCRKYG